MAPDSEPLQTMPMTPRSSLAGLGPAVIAWARSRRGRTLAIGAVLFVVMLALLGQSDSLPSSHIGLTSNYHIPSWRAYLSNAADNVPSILHSPFSPSNTTLELENGTMKHPPSQLHKATPNFHLLMTALEDSPEFCRTTVSAMILNYPPPTIINLFHTFDSQLEREKARVESIRDYLFNGKLVKDEDLVLLVDGQDTWFQLPSDVMIRQYRNVVADASKQLLDKYGVDVNGEQRFNATIVFAAGKTCEGEDLACQYAPRSTLPRNIYGKETGKETVLMPARYPDSGMMMGPANNLRALYDAAVKKFEADEGMTGTVQSVFATIFGEQQLSRDTEIQARKSANPGWLSWFGGYSISEHSKPPAYGTLKEGHQYEFSISLDYTHTLFQTLHHVAEDELVPLPHDNSTDLSKYHHPGTPKLSLSLPIALLQAKPPFWTPDLLKHSPNPSNKPPFIEPLQIQEDIDDLKPADTTWEELHLIQNTYTGAVPATFHLNSPPAPLKTRRTTSPPTESAAANLTSSNLWYAPYTRALLRRALRLQQSPQGYHAAAVGGDLMWDQRGGRGGVWTQSEQAWLPWGEVDGVCGSLEQMQGVFADGKGVWLREGVEGAEEERRKEEEALKEKVAERLRKEKEFARVKIKEMTGHRRRWIA